MPRRKIAVTVDESTVRQIDRLVAAGRFPNRSRAVNSALIEALKHQKRSRLAAECDKLDVREEKALAEEGLGVDEWPAY
jgi:Arc/MetJ-type ribon-helix-helix transcriptional regulator